MHTFSPERGAVRAISLVSRRALRAGRGLAAASLAVTFAVQTSGVAMSQEPQPTTPQRRAARCSGVRGAREPVRAQQSLCAAARGRGDSSLRMSAARSGS